VRIHMKSQANRNRIFNPTLWFALGLLVAAGERAFAQESPTANSAKNRAEVLLKEMFSNPNAIKTCVFDGQETVTSIDCSGVESQTVARFSGAVDEPKKRMRFDYKQSQGQERIFNYIESPESRTVYSEVTRFHITRGPVVHHSDRPYELFDVRCIGAFTPGELKDGLFPELRDKFIEITERSSSKSIAGSGMIELTRTVAKGLAQVRHVLDPAKGCAPVLLETRYKNKDGSLSDVKHRVEIKWIKVGEIWLPEMAKSSNFHKSASWTERVLKLNWRHVNEELNPKLFDAGSLKLVDGTSIVDQKTDPKTPRLVDIVNSKDGEP